MIVLPVERHIAMPPSRFLTDLRDPDRDRESLSLAALPTAVGAARRFVAAQLRKWGLDPLTDACELVVSELVTNSVVVLRQAADPTSYVQLHDHPPPLIVLQLRLTWRRLFCELWDPDPNSPIQMRPGALDEGGRGLLLVANYASNWGCYPSPAGQGKCVVAWWELQP